MEQSISDDDEELDEEEDEELEEDDDDYALILSALELFFAILGCSTLFFKTGAYSLTDT